MRRPAWFRVGPSDRRPTLPYVMVPHEPDLWVRAHVEKQSKYNGRWRLGCYYFVGILQHYRVYDADQCRPEPSAAELHHDEHRDPPAGNDPTAPIDLRDTRQVDPPRLTLVP
jgi:hypothetical protein